MNDNLFGACNSCLSDTHLTEEQCWFIRERQILSMAEKWPEFEIITISNSLKFDFPGYLVEPTVWVGPLQPTDISKVYLVEVAFFPVPTKFPVVKIIDPEITYHPDIHMFLSRNNLCLFDSRNFSALKLTPRSSFSEWKKTKIWPSESEWNLVSLISETTIPWTAEWLFHYENWAVTGEWYGGGHEFDEEDSVRSMKLQLELARLRKIKKKRLRQLRRIQK